MQRGGLAGIHSEDRKKASEGVLFTLIRVAGGGLFIFRSKRGDGCVRWMV